MIFEGKRILITGGTGSLGKKLVYNILSKQYGSPKKIIVFLAMRQNKMKCVSNQKVIYFLRTKSFIKK